MSVFVLDQRHQPLMPCSEKRARLYLQRGRAVVHRCTPLVIRLLDRRVDHSLLQPVVLRLDTGSRRTGMALVRVEEAPEGQVHHALHLAELVHRGAAIHQALCKRAGYRRRRRAAHCGIGPLASATAADQQAGCHPRSARAWAMS